MLLATGTEGGLMEHMPHQHMLFAGVGLTKEQAQQMGQAIRDQRQAK
jgi:Spy/CpxP family protein refolding chaperone